MALKYRAVAPFPVGLGLISFEELIIFLVENRRCGGGLIKALAKQEGILRAEAATGSIIIVCRSNREKEKEKECLDIQRSKMLVYIFRLGFPL